MLQSPPEPRPSFPTAPTSMFAVQLIVVFFLIDHIALPCSTIVIYAGAVEESAALKTSFTCPFTVVVL